MRWIGTSKILCCAMIVAALSAALTLRIFATESARPFGITKRPKSKAFLQMPETANGSLPKLLSQTGAFKDVSKLTPADDLIPYDIIVPFWSDGAEKSRWISVPSAIASATTSGSAPHEPAHPLSSITNGGEGGRRPGEEVRRVQGEAKIHFAATGEWTFPAGTVFVKHFALATNENNPNSLRRLETRLLVCDSTGAVYGVTYKWRSDNSDADLLTTNLTEAIPIQTATGVRTQMWYYPNRSDCLTCHTPTAGFVLGVKTRQLNRDFAYPSGFADNELRVWNHLGLFDTNLDESALKDFPKLAASDDTSRPLEDRARSYLDANCAHCHRPNGTIAEFDTRYDIPLAKQNLVNAGVLFDQRIDGARIVVPNDIWRSLLFMRANTTEPFKMPPLARNRIDQRGMSLLREWIESLPGPPVLPPPEISPGGGNYDQPVEVSLRSEAGAKIYYTLDGTVPTTSDLLYEKPIRLTTRTIVRAKAFKTGFTRSITSQETFLIAQP